MNLNTKSETFTSDRLRQLADDPSNLVYEYKVDPNAPRSMSSDVARDMIYTIRARYATLRETHQPWTDDECRERLCIENRDWRSFASTHKFIFTHATDRSTTQDGMKHLFYILFMYKRLEQGAITKPECDERVQAYMLKHFSRGPASATECESVIPPTEIG